MVKEIVRFEDHVVEDLERFYESIIKYLAWLELRSRYRISRGKVRVKYQPYALRDGVVEEAGETIEIEVEDSDPTWICRVTVGELRGRRPENKRKTGNQTVAL